MMVRAEASSTFRMVGGEMFGSSDVKDRPGAGGEALLELLRRSVPRAGDVLVVGPHDVRVMEVLAGQCASLTVLLRSHRDAEAIHKADIAANVTVACGSLLKFAPEQQFEVIVALDGMDRLVSVEGAQCTWDHCARLLSTMLAPGGRLVLDIANEFGVNRLADLPSSAAELEDGRAAWSSFIKADRTRPSTLRQATRQLEAENLVAEHVFSAFPSPHAVSALVSTQVLADDNGPLPYLHHAIAIAITAGRTEGPALVDPRNVMRSAINAGLGAELAPGWTVVAVKSDVAGEPSSVPAAIVCEPQAGPLLGMAYEVFRDDHGEWHRRPLQTVTMKTKSTDITRFPSALHTPLFDNARLFDEALLAECAARDTAAIRATLAGYLTWLAGLATDGHLTGWRVFTAPENVIVNDEHEFSCMDPSWSTGSSYPVEVVLTRGLLRFAEALLTGGYAHPWPGISTRGDLARTLAAIVGNELDADVLEQAEALDERILANVSESLATSVSYPLGYRELVQLSETQKEQLQHAQAKLEWYEEMLASREHSLRKAQAVVDVLSANRLYRIARFGVRLLRRARRRARQLVSPTEIRRIAGRFVVPERRR